MVRNGCVRLPAAGSSVESSPFGDDVVGAPVGSAGVGPTGEGGVVHAGDRGRRVLAEDAGIVIRECGRGQGGGGCRGRRRGRRSLAATCQARQEEHHEAAHRQQGGDYDRMAPRPTGRGLQSSAGVSGIRTQARSRRLQVCCETPSPLILPRAAWRGHRRKATAPTPPPPAAPTRAAPRCACRPPGHVAVERRVGELAVRGREHQAVVAGELLRR